MRWLAVLLIVVACGGSKSTPTRADKLNVEDVALWFARAALSGDRATARSLTLTYDQVAQLSNRAEPTEWEAAIVDVLDRMEREGAESGGQIVAATVVKRHRLEPGRDSKVLRAIDIAVVRYEVRERDGRTHPSPVPWIFMKTDAGWKFSPKQ
jgi:hypothetical protein